MSAFMWKHWRAIIAWLVAALAILTIAACSRTDPLRDLLPSCIPPELVEALGNPDDTDLRTYGQDHGMIPLLYVVRAFDESYDCRTLEAFVRSERILNAPYERVLNILATEFGLPCYLDAYRQIAAFGTGERREIRKLTELNYAAVQAQVPAHEIEPVRHSLRHFEAAGFLHGAAMARSTLAELYLRTGNMVLHEAFIRSSLADYRRAGNTRMVCQQLGVLGSRFLARGQADSMRVCWDEALGIAIAHRLPDQAPRILNFYARLYQREGRTALAHEMLRASVDLANEYQAADMGRRFVAELGELYASLGYWDLAARLVDRASLFSRLDPCQYHDPVAFPALGARVLMARGQVDEADRLFASIRRGSDSQITPDRKAKLHLEWAEGLIANGENRRALPVIDGVLDEPTGLLDRLWLVRAEAALNIGDLAASEEALERFVSEAASDEGQRSPEWISHDSLRLDLALARGDTISAWRLGANGLARVEHYFAGTDASMEGYLVADGALRFRSSLHRLIRGDAWLGYGAALHWIALHRSLGGESQAAPVDDPDPRAAVRNRFANLARTTASEIERAGAWHLTYAVVGGEVWRWSVAQGRIRQDTLSMDAASLRALLAEASGIVSGTAQADREAGEVLERLSAVLLPPDLRTDAPPTPGTILITADGFLGVFPFETLNVDPKHYTPLLARCDVAYLRPGATHPGLAAADNGVVFLSPASPGGLNARYPFSPALRAAPVEANLAKSLVPRARFLSGETATKRALTSQWEHCGLIYIVGHIIRDPEVPYMVLLPAAAPSPQAAVDECYLDVRDVRAADLSRCGLVVLSGCSSGLPYSRQGTVSPSLAQAFIDAGAQRVVHTFWDVSDQQACDLMVDFMHHRRSGLSVVRALGEARRGRIHNLDEAAPRFGWSAYGVTVSSADFVAR